MDEYTRNGRDNEKKQRNRFIGKLFKEPKKPTSEVEVDDFLHGTADRFLMVSDTHSQHPSLERIDASVTQQWPVKLQIHSSGVAKNSSATLKRSRKGLVVRFSDDQPELIGEGGDLSEIPPIDVSLRKKAILNQPILTPKEHSSIEARAAHNYGHEVSHEFNSNENSYSNGSRQIDVESQPNFKDWMNIGDMNDQISNQILDSQPEIFSFKSNKAGKCSFSQKVKDEMRSGEGMTLVASRNSINEGDLSGSFAVEGMTSQLEELHLNTMSNAIKSDSVRSLNPVESQINENSIGNSTEILTTTEYPIPSNQASQSFIDIQDFKSIAGSVPEVATSLEEEALTEFSKRTAHFSTLFRLSTEATKPVSACPFELLVRAGLWWFLKGRMNLEAAVRERPVGVQTQSTNNLNLHQAYMDLAKSQWILEMITSKSASSESYSKLDKMSTDTLDAKNSVTCSMRKLAMSMKRNHFFPQTHHDFPLTPKLDPSFWAPEDGDKSMIFGLRLISVPSILGSLPLGDSSQIFHYGRIFADAVLTEEGAPQKYRCPVLLSVTRSHQENSIQAIISNQDGTLNFAIQSDKSLGPTWENFKWHARKSIIEIHLPRGFSLCLYCSEIDFGTIWRLYDNEKRTYGIMSQRPGEKFVFETILKNFHYLDESPYPTFCKEPQSSCHLRLYEKIEVIKVATGPRTLHRGFRLAIITSSKFKNVKGIDLDLLPGFLTEFSLLRGDDGSPALLLRLKGTSSKRTLVATFREISERICFHALLTGRALGPNEVFVAKGRVKEFALSTTNRKVVSLPQTLEWQSYMFINQQCDDLQGFKTVLSDRLRIILEFKFGTMTDRVNVGPGELKLRLDPRRLCELQVVRQPQIDWTTLIESQAPRGLPQELEGILNIIKMSESTRAYIFPSMTELHLFQVALTGYEVLFDEVVTSLNISRRRMVVPIYKKWDAIMPRIQVVKKEKVIQLVVFFENFSHGDCMNFVIRSTDIFESCSRSGKYSLRIVDAKFALPKTKIDGVIFDHEFVCLDMPEYPGEHDDISIHFDNENENDYKTKIQSFKGDINQFRFAATSDVNEGSIDRNQAVEGDQEFDEQYLVSRLTHEVYWLRWYCNDLARDLTMVKRDYYKLESS